jgi:hypothetical protein
MLEEALAYLYAAFDPEHPGYQGERYQLENFPLSPMSDRRVPLLVGGTGEYKTPRLAGTYAEEFNVYPGPNYAERIKRCKDAAVAAGRDPEAILISSAGQVIAKETQEEFEEHLNEVAIERGMTRAELDAYFALRRPPQGTFEQVRNILDEYTEMACNASISKASMEIPTRASCSMGWEFTDEPNHDRLRGARLGPRVRGHRTFDGVRPRLGGLRIQLAAHSARTDQDPHGHRSGPSRIRIHRSG